MCVCVGGGGVRVFCLWVCGVCVRVLFVGCVGVGLVSTVDTPIFSHKREHLRHREPSSLICVHQKLHKNTYKLLFKKIDPHCMYKDIRSAVADNLSDYVCS